MIVQIPLTRQNLRAKAAFIFASMEKDMVDQIGSLVELSIAANQVAFLLVNQSMMCQSVFERLQLRITHIAVHVHRLRDEGFLILATKVYQWLGRESFWRRYLANQACACISCQIHSLTIHAVFEFWCFDFNIIVDFFLLHLNQLNLVEEVAKLY